MNSGVHFSSQTDEWSTPQGLFDLLNKKYKFSLDVCASANNAKVGRYFDRAADGLAQSWRGEVCWMNPPYGKEIGRWMRKAADEASQSGTVVVCLVPARTDTAWWHDYAMRGRVEFLRGRLRFGAASNSAPFPSAVVVFGEVAA